MRRPASSSAGSNVAFEVESFRSKGNVDENSGKVFRPSMSASRNVMGEDSKGVVAPTDVDIVDGGFVEEFDDVPVLPIVFSDIWSDGVSDRALEWLKFMKDCVELVGVSSIMSSDRSVGGRWLLLYHDAHNESMWRDDERPWGCWWERDLPSRCASSAAERRAK